MLLSNYLIKSSLILLFLLNNDFVSTIEPASTTMASDEVLYDMTTEYSAESVEQTDLPNTSIDDSANLDDPARWYKFLYSLNDKLSEYDVQKQMTKDKDIFSLMKLNDWEDMHKNLKDESGKSKLILYLNRIYEKFNILKDAYVNQKRITIAQINELNRVLEMSFKNEINEKCIGSTKVIEGSYISLDKLKRDNYLDNDCYNLDTDEPKSVSILASNKIFIDADIDLPEHRLIFIAPKWEVLGNRTIDVSGTPASSFIPHSHDEDFEVMRCKVPGQNGNPGQAGGSGGIFFGIGDEFVNEENLRIVANGGKGGPGEKGCPGDEGKDGEAVKLDLETMCGDRSCADKYLNPWDPEKFSCSSYVDPAMSKPDCSVLVPGYPGDIGDKGGDGGRGGKGGKHGFIVLFETSRKSKISKYASEGDKGEDGQGGKGGMGGQHGDNLHASTDYYQYLRHKTFYVVMNARIPGYTISKNNSRAARGPVGTPGANTEEQEEPSEVKRVYNPSAVISEYKGFLRKNLQNYVNPQPLIKFLKRLEYDTNVNSLYGLLGLFDDQLKLEKQFYELNIGSGNIPFYESLLNRANKFLKYVQRKKKGNELIQYKKSLKYLYTAALRKIDGLKENYNSLMITDIEHYISSLKVNIDKLKQYEEEKSKADSINYERRKYKENIEKKIREAKDLKKNQISNEIDNINKQIDNQIVALVGKVKASITNEQNNKKKLENEKIELQKNLKWKALFNVLDFASQSLSYFGPVGAFAGSVAEDMIGVAEDHALGGKKFGVAEMMQLSPKLIGHIREGKDIYENGLEMGNEVIKMTKSEKIDKFLGKSQMFLQTGTAMVTDLTEKFKQDKAELDLIDQAIAGSQEEFHDLIDFKERIKSEIVPIIYGFQNDLKKYEKNMGTESKVALDVTKWQLHKKLESLKLEISQLTQGFDMSQSFKKSVDHLLEAMDVLIDVYKYIQECKEKKEMVDYIADVNSAHANRIGITDTFVDKAINDLEILIRYNLMLEQYRLCIEAFKQFAFPFAHLYLKQIALPESLSPTYSLDEDANEVIDKIESMMSNLQKYENFHTIYGKRIGYGEFNSRRRTTQPFFEWKNEEYKKEISDLLSGKDVLIRADINKLDMEEDAVKFKVLALELKTKNESKQSEMNELLKAFRVNLVHLGDSFYKFDGKVYVIPTKNYSIWYDFDTDSDGKPIRVNGEYESIKNGEYMLSPYGLWKISLTKLRNRDNINFTHLKKYESEVDLELAGEASFVIQDHSDDVKLELDKYYKTVESNQLDPNDNNAGFDSIYRGIANKDLLVQKINQVYQETKPEKINKTKRESNFRRFIFNDWYTMKQPYFI